MRALPFMVSGACALLMAGCVADHPGPTFPVVDDSHPSSSGSGESTPSQTFTDYAEASGQKKAHSSRSVNANDIFPGASAYEQADSPSVNAPAPPPDTDDETPVASKSGSTDSDEGSSFDNLEVVDASLNGKLGILRVGSEPGPNSLLSVFVGLKNKTAQRLVVEAQTLYKDQAGNALNTGSWVAMALRPHEETVYRSSSISTAATDFLVRIRKARTTDSDMAP